MAYAYKGRPAAVEGSPLLSVEQERKRNAELHLELKAVTAENKEIDQRIRLMRDELATAYRKLRKQVRDLEAVRAEERLIAEAKTFKSKLPPPRFGGPEGLKAATEELMAHEARNLKLSKEIIANGPIHGTWRRYEAGCRCKACRGWRALKSTRYRANLDRREQQAAA